VHLPRKVDVAVASAYIWPVSVPRTSAAIVEVAVAAEANSASCVLVDEKVEVAVALEVNSPANTLVAEYVAVAVALAES
jgi:hypothetical protein